MWYSKMMVVFNAIVVLFMVLVLQEGWKPRNAVGNGNKMVVSTVLIIRSREASSSNGPSSSSLDAEDKGYYATCEHNKGLHFFDVELRKYKLTRILKTITTLVFYSNTFCLISEE